MLDTSLSIKPEFGKNCFLAENSTVVGEVTMGAIVMDDAVVRSGSIIAAGAVVLAGTIVEPGSIYAGIPTKKVKQVTEEMDKVFERTAKNYIKYA